MIVNIVFGKNEKKKKENEIYEESEERETEKGVSSDKFISLKKIKKEPSILKFLYNELAKEKENWRKEKEKEKNKLDEEIKYKRDMLEKYMKEQKEMIEKEKEKWKLEKKEEQNRIENRFKEQREYNEEIKSLLKLLKEELIEEKNRFHEDIKEKKEELRKKEEELNKKEKELEKKFKSS